MLPDGTRDCHTHVFGPRDRFPLRRTSLTAATPVATIEQLIERNSALNIRSSLIVNPVEYGDDTSCLLDALATAGAEYRGAIMMTDTLDMRSLERLHLAGVRGFRTMLPKRLGLAPSPQTLARCIDAARVLGWHIRVLMSPDDIAEAVERLAPAIEASTPIVIEHMATLPPAMADLKNPAFAALLRFLRHPSVWMQLSGAARLSRRPDYADVKELADRYVSSHKMRCVWATDWPNVGGSGASDATMMVLYADSLKANRMVQDTLLLRNPARLLGL